MYRGNRVLKPWIVKEILNGTEGKKPGRVVKVLRQAEGPGPDGTVIKEVTDGNVTIKAVFTSAALSEFSQQSEESSPVCWDSAKLILKDYTVVPGLRNKRPHFVLIVSDFSLWSLEEGFRLKREPPYCMDNGAVAAKAQQLLAEPRSPDQSRTRIEELSLDSSSLLGVLAQLAEGSIDDSSNAPQDAIQNSSMVSTSPKPGPSRSRKRQKLSDRVRTPDSASQQKALRLRSNAERNIPGENAVLFDACGVGPRPQGFPPTHTLPITAFLISAEDEQKLDAIPEWKKGCRNLQTSEPSTIDSAMPAESQMHSEQVGSNPGSSELAQDEGSHSRTGDPGGKARYKFRNRNQPHQSSTTGDPDKGRNSKTDTPAVLQKQYQRHSVSPLEASDANPESKEHHTDQGNVHTVISHGCSKVVRAEQTLEMQCEDCGDNSHEVSGGFAFTKKGTDSPSKGDAPKESLNPTSVKLEPGHQELLCQEESSRIITITPDSEPNGSAEVSSLLCPEIPTSNHGNSAHMDDSLSANTSSQPLKFALIVPEYHPSPETSNGACNVSVQVSSSLAQGADSTQVKNTSIQVGASLLATQESSLLKKPRLDGVSEEMDCDADREATVSRDLPFEHWTCQTPETPNDPDSNVPETASLDRELLDLAADVKASQTPPRHSTQTPPRHSTQQDQGTSAGNLMPRISLSPVEVTSVMPPKSSESQGRRKSIFSPYHFKAVPSRQAAQISSRRKSDRAVEEEEEILRVMSSVRQRRRDLPDIRKEDRRLEKLSAIAEPEATHTSSDIASSSDMSDKKRLPRKINRPDGSHPHQRKKVVEPSQPNAAVLYKPNTHPPRQRKNMTLCKNADKILMPDDDLSTQETLPAETSQMKHQVRKGAKDGSTSPVQCSAARPTASSTQANSGCRASEHAESNLQSRKNLSGDAVPRTSSFAQNGDSTLTGRESSQVSARHIISRPRHASRSILPVNFHCSKPGLSNYAPILPARKLVLPKRRVSQSKVPDTVSPQQLSLPAYQSCQKRSMNKSPQTSQDESTFRSLLPKITLNEVDTMEGLFHEEVGKKGKALLGVRHSRRAKASTKQCLNLL